MAENLSQLDSQRLDVALATWPQWQPGPARRPRIMSRLGGESNDSFLVSDGSERWALRLNAAGTVLGVDRQNESAAHCAAAHAGIAPTVVYFTLEFLVTPFIAGAQACLSDLSDIGTLLSRVHELPVDLPALNPLAYLRENLQVDLIALANDSNHQRTLLDDCACWLENNYPSEGIIFTPSHNDCLLANMIKSESGLMLIDWEYACGMDPAFDLAAVCASSKLSEAQRSQLLQGYGVGKIDTDFLKRLRYYLYYYQLIEILWWRRRGKKNAEQLGALAREILKR